MNGIKRLAKKGLGWLNYRLGRFEDRIFVLGDGRSGTTWLMKIFNFDGLRREIFEPLNSHNFPEYPPYESEFPFPDRDEPVVEKQIRAAARGSYITAQVTYSFPRFLYRGLLIKDINAHLVLDQVFAVVPDMPAVLILRHPFAVADSKTRAYFWKTSPRAFLGSHCPYREQLEPHRQLIEATTDRHEELVLVWCLVHHLAFSSREIHRFSFVFYENLVLDPLAEAERLYREIGREDVFCRYREQISTACRRKSHVTKEHNTIRKSRGGTARWQDEWPETRIERCLAILEAFGLDRIYGRDHLPLLDADGLRNLLPKRD